MSEIKVDKISPQSGVALEVGDSGDTITCSGTPVGFGGGKVLQVVSTTLTGDTSTTSLTFVDVSGLSVSITPSSTSSKILVFGHACMSCTTSSRFGGWHIRLMRDSTIMSVGTTSAATQLDSAGGGLRYDPHHSAQSESFHELDSPSSTSSLTYKLQYARTNYSAITVYVNRMGDIVTTDYDGNGVSTITAMEIGA